MILLSAPAPGLLVCAAGRLDIQPVRLIAVQSREGLAKIGKGANIYGAPLAVIVCADHIKAWVRPFDKKQTTDIDASILTDHMMLQAAQEGFGSVWICYFKPDEPFMTQALEILLILPIN